MGGLGSRAWLACTIASALAACYPTNHTCGGATCPAGFVCAPPPYDQIQHCISPAQLTACDGKGSGDDCTYAGIDKDIAGFCYGETCVEGVYMCGDGRVDPGEQCDCGSQETPTGGLRTTARTDGLCHGLFNGASGALCHDRCTIARCGDGVTDPGEVYDDGNNVSGDGWRADCQGRFDQLVLPPTPEGITGVWTSSTNHAHVFTSGGDWIYDGQGWTSTALGTDPTVLPMPVWGDAPNHVFAGTQMTGLSMYNGSSWNPVQLAAYGMKQVTSISGNGPDVLVGGRAATTGFALVLHSKDGGVTWMPAQMSTCDNAYASKVPVSGPYVQVVGTTDFYVGTTFNLTSMRMCHTTPESTNVWQALVAAGIGPMATDGTLGYVLGGGVGAPWQGIGVLNGTPLTSLYVVPAPVGTITGFAVSSPTEVLVITNQGNVLAFNPMTMAWTKIPSTTERALTAISATSEHDVFIVGDNDTVIH